MADGDTENSKSKPEPRLQVVEKKDFFIWENSSVKKHPIVFIPAKKNRDAAVGAPQLSAHNHRHFVRK